MPISCFKTSIVVLLSMAGIMAFGQMNELGMRISYAKMDAFNGIEYSRVSSRFKQDVAFEWGVNRTYLQRRFFPRITLGSSFLVLDKKSFILAPLVSYGYALLKTNFLTKSFHQWHELFGGFKMEVGSKWKGAIAISGGWLMEQYFDTYLNRQSFIHTLGFNGAVSLVYCW